MPRKPIDYSKAMIYTISKGDLVYVGSTTDFTKRKSQHKAVCNNEKDRHYISPVYMMIRENGGWDTFTMKPYKLFPCKTKMELLIEEERVRRELATMNKSKAIRSQEEATEYRKDYYIENKVEKLEWQKQYHIEHKDERNTYTRLHNSERVKCECGSIVRKDVIKKHRNSAKHTRLLSLLNTNVSVEKEAKDEGETTGSASLSK
jgi:hypothetical protein